MILLLQLLALVFLLGLLGVAMLAREVALLLVVVALIWWDLLVIAG